MSIVVTGAAMGIGRAVALRLAGEQRPLVRGMSKSIHGPEHLALRELLVEARKAAGLTQQRVAEKLRRPQSHSTKVEMLSVLMRER